jgi:hypothetical protein
MGLVKLPWLVPFPVQVGSELTASPLPISYPDKLYSCIQSQGYSLAGRVMPVVSPPTSARLSYSTWRMYLPLWANAPGSFAAYW